MSKAAASTFDTQPSRASGRPRQRNSIPGNREKCVHLALICNSSFTSAANLRRPKGASGAHLPANQFPDRGGLVIQFFQVSWERLADATFRSVIQQRLPQSEMRHHFHMQNEPSFARRAPRNAATHCAEGRLGSEMRLSIIARPTCPERMPLESVSAAFFKSA